MAAFSEFSKTWNVCFKNYATDIARIYKLHPEQILCCMSLESVPDSLNECYLSLVKENELTPLENLPITDKTRIWNESKKYSDNQTKRINISRSIYLLEQLTA